MNKKKLTRRDVLRNLSLGVGGSLGIDPFWQMMEIMFSSLASKAYAQVNDLAPRKFVMITQSGAPPRWTWDLILNNNESDSIINNPHVATRYTEQNGRYTGVEYKSVRLNGMNVPYIWGLDVPKAGGGQWPMAKLLQHMLHMRGVNTNDQGHGGSRRQQTRPPTSSRTLIDHLTDVANAPIPLIENRASIATLIDPYIVFEHSGLNGMKGKVRAARAAFDDYTRQLDPKMAAVVRDMERVETMVDRIAEGLKYTFDDILDKYENLVTRAYETSIPGINDKPVGASGDLRSSYTAGLAMSIAATFATAEFAITNGIGQAVTRSLSGNFDEHGVDSMNTLIKNSLYNFAFASCLLEFSEALKREGQWNDTLVYVGGEFNRSPRSAGTGSDHAAAAASVALYSGAFKRPQIIGNIRASRGSAYSGLYGLQAPIQGVNQNLITSHVASTMATILRVPSNVNSSYVSLVKENSDGSIESIVEPGKVVPQD